MPRRHRELAVQLERARPGARTVAERKAIDAGSLSLREAIEALDATTARLRLLSRLVGTNGW